MYCVICGAENPEFAAYCEKCGKTVGWRVDQRSTERQPEGTPPTTQAISNNRSSDLDGEQSTGQALNRGDDAREPQKANLQASNNKRSSFSESTVSFLPPTAKAIRLSPSEEGGVAHSATNEGSGARKAGNEFFSLPRGSSLWISTWFVGLFIFNAWSRWADNTDRGILYLLAGALSQFTSPIELLSSALAVWAIRTVSKKGSREGERQARRTLAARNPVYLLAGAVGCVSIIGVVIILQSRNDSTLIANPPAQPKTDAKKDLSGSNLTDSHEIMSRSNAEIGSESEGLTGEAKKRLREMLALQLAGGLLKQNNPIRIDVLGEEHDVLLFQLSSMSDQLSSDLIQSLSTDDAQFWNAARLMAYKEIVFTGDSYKRVVTRKEFLRYGKNYENYKIAFLKAAGSLTAGAKGELNKP
jgi:hypothetical protein